MNINATLIARIEARLLETKNPCKLYATEAAAETTAAKLAVEFAHIFGGPGARPMRYVIVMIPSVRKYAVGFDLTELMNRPGFSGGYVGLWGARGFYTF